MLKQLIRAALILSVPFIAPAQNAYVTNQYGFVSFRQACVRRAAAAAVSAVAREIDGFPWRRSGPPWPARPGSA